MNEIDQLRTFVREHKPGGCKLLSKGDACPCALCAIDKLAAAIRKTASVYVNDNYNGQYYECQLCRQTSQLPDTISHAPDCLASL